MKKRITALLTLLLLALPAQAGAASVGEVVGHVYSTDITAYVDGMLIPSYNIGGKTAVIAEDLMDYGFEVVWDEENRTLSVSALEVPAEAPVPAIPEEARTPGLVIGDVYATDIRVDVNEIPVTAYNIGGKTAIAFDEIGGETERFQGWGSPAFEGVTDKYGIFLYAERNKNDGYTMNGFREIWDEEARISYLEVLRKGSSIEVDGNRYQISEVDYPRYHGSDIYLFYYDSEGAAHKIKTERGLYDYFSISFFQPLFGDRWTLNDGKLILDLRGDSKQFQRFCMDGVLAYNEDNAGLCFDTYAFFSDPPVGGDSNHIPYITIPATLIREDGETAHELKGAVYRGEVLIEMDSFLEIL